MSARIDGASTGSRRPVDDHAQRRSQYSGPGGAHHQHGPSRQRLNGGLVDVGPQRLAAGRQPHQRPDDCLCCKAFTLDCSASTDSIR